LACKENPAIVFASPPEANSERRNILPLTKTANPPKTLEDQRNSWLSAILERRSGTNPNAGQIADATVAVWDDIASVLQSIIGKQGFAALYNRSAALAARQYRWLANSRAGDDHTMTFDGLRSIIAQQSNESAALGSSELLQTFYCVLASLIGPALCEQLLATIRDELAPPLPETPTHEA
jgi:hypothetical protein